MRVSKKEQEEARATLRELLPPGSTAYTILRHVSRSGMSRDIDVVTIEDGQPRWISRLVSLATGTPMRGDYCRVGGCGMDMGFALIHELSYALYPNGFECVGKGNGHADYCPSNDHSNGDRDYTPHHHNSGGYALRQHWM